MNIYQLIQSKMQSLVMTSADDNYYSLLLFIISSITIFAIIMWFLTGFILPWLMSDKHDKLGKKVVRKVQNLVFGTIIFCGIVGTLVVFVNSSSIFGQSMFKIVTTLFIVYFTFSIISIGKAILVMLSHREDARFITQQTLPLFHNSASIFIFFMMVYITLAFVWNVNMTALLASLGIVGVALSFAARDTIANFFSGIFIMADQPYQVGDFIDLESGERGEVIDIGIRSTRILTMDDVEIVVPNSIMGNTPVINESGGTSRKTRIEVATYIAYGSNVKEIKDILITAARQSEYVVENPAPIARFVEFGESGMYFKILCWIEEASERGQAIDVLNTNIYDALNNAGVEIPYQKHDLYIKGFKKNSNL